MVDRDTKEWRRIHQNKMQIVEHIEAKKDRRTDASVARNFGSRYVFSRRKWKGVNGTNVRMYEWTGMILTDAV